MKLLIVTRENREDRAYGLGKTLLPIVLGLQQRGYQVDYFSKEQCPEVHARWQPRFQRILKPLLPELTAPIAERLVQGYAAGIRALTQGYSHLWLHDPWLVTGVKLALLRRGVLRRPFKMIITEHGLGSFIWSACQDGLNVSPARYRRLLHYERRVLLAADRVISPSYRAQQALLRDLGLLRPPPHFCVLGYGRPELNLPEREPARQQLGLSNLPANAPVIMAAGRLSPVKGFELLPQAASLLQQRYQIQPQLLIAGGGDATDLQHQCAQLKLIWPPVIGFMDSISTPLAACDFYLSTCAAESYGQANREALAAGCVSIVPSSGGSAEVLGSGAIMQPLSPAALAERIAFLWQHPDHYHYWQQQALQEAQRWPPWSELIPDYEQTLIEA